MDELIAKLATEEGRREFRQTSSWWRFYHPYLTCLKHTGFRGALIMHGLSEEQVKSGTSFLRELLESLSPQTGLTSCPFSIATVFASTTAMKATVCRLFFSTAWAATQLSRVVCTTLRRACG